MKTIKRALSTVFDKLFSDRDDPPSNAKLSRNMLWKIKHIPEPTTNEPPDDIFIAAFPFNISDNVNVKVRCDMAVFGLDIMNDEIRNRSHARDMCPNSSASSLNVFKNAKDLLSQLLMGCHCALNRSA